MRNVLKTVAGGIIPSARAGDWLRVPGQAFKRPDRATEFHPIVRGMRLAATQLGDMPAWRYDHDAPAARVGVLQPALDASVSAKASNSLEIMLCHQLAATHHAAMRLNDATQIARLMNAAARQMDSYQTGMLALMKFKAAGKQTVTVHHQHV